MGLGNPGVRYRNTRHNVGFHVVDALAAQLDIPLRKPFLRPWRVGRGQVAPAHGGASAVPADALKRSAFPGVTGGVPSAELRAPSEAPGRQIVLAQPLTFMNRSGEAVGPLLERYASSPADLLVVCDTLDLPVGRCRLRLKGSAGGHRGLDSTIRRLGSGDFKRLVVGIGRPAAQEDVVGWVLGEPDGEEAARLREAVSQAAQAILRLLDEEPVKVMNALNSRT